MTAVWTFAAPSSVDSLFSLSWSGPFRVRWEFFLHKCNHFALIGRAVGKSFKETCQAFSRYLLIEGCLA